MYKLRYNRISESSEVLGAKKNVLILSAEYLRGLTDNQKSCFISVDEIHIKPGISYRGNHLIGHAVDTDTPQAATTVLAMMINPSLGAPAFVGRLLPVFSLKAEFLYDQVTKMINVIHEAGGFCLSSYVR